MSGEPGARCRDTCPLMVLQPNEPSTAANRQAASRMRCVRRRFIGFAPDHQAIACRFRFVSNIADASPGS